MSELDMIFEQLRTIAADIATMQEALGLLVEALHPPPTAPFWGRFFENGHDTHVFTLTPVPVAPAA